MQSKSSRRDSCIKVAIGAGVSGLALAIWVSAQAQVVVPPDPLPTLKTLKGVPVPEPHDLMLFVKNRQAAIVLGKALFWDPIFGSDGKTACASCHFQAGADNRVKNQIGPGLNNQHGAPISTTFNKPFLTEGGNPPSTTTASGGLGGPNYRLNFRDFPSHQLSDPLDRNSPVLYDSDDVVSSQGVFCNCHGSTFDVQAAVLCTSVRTIARWCRIRSSKCRDTIREEWSQGIRRRSSMRCSISAISGMDARTTSSMARTPSAIEIPTQARG